jgi:hypothetical protein
VLAVALTLTSDVHEMAPGAAPFETVTGIADEAVFPAASNAVAISV